MGARSLVKPTGSILNSCYEISKQIVSVNGAYWLVKSGAGRLRGLRLLSIYSGFALNFISNLLFSRTIRHLHIDIAAEKLIEHLFESLLSCGWQFRPRYP